MFSGLILRCRSPAGNLNNVHLSLKIYSLYTNMFVPNCAVEKANDWRFEMEKCNCNKRILVFLCMFHDVSSVIPQMPRNTRMQNKVQPNVSTLWNRGRFHPPPTIATTGGRTRPRLNAPWLPIMGQMPVQVFCRAMMLRFRSVFSSWQFSSESMLSIFYRVALRSVFKHNGFIKMKRSAFLAATWMLDETSELHLANVTRMQIPHKHETFAILIRFWWRVSILRIRRRFFRTAAIRFVSADDLLLYWWSRGDQLTAYVSALIDIELHNGWRAKKWNVDGETSKSHLHWAKNARKICSRCN